MDRNLKATPIRIAARENTVHVRRFHFRFAPRLVHA